MMSLISPNILFIYKKRKLISQNRSYQEFNNIDIERV